VEEFSIVPDVNVEEAIRSEGLAATQSQHIQKSSLQPYSGQDRFDQTLHL